MKTFTDSLGRAWDLSLNVAIVRRIQSATGVSVWRLVEDDIKPLGEFMGDVVLFVDVLFTIVEAQAKRLNIDGPAFAEGLGGDTLDSAMECFLECLIDFFPKPQTRESLRAVIAKGREIHAMAVGIVKEKLDRIDGVKIMNHLRGNAPESSE